MSGVLGLDGCKAGWIGIVLSSDAEPAAVFGTTVDDAVHAASAPAALSVIAIDIPIGLPEDGPRQADVLARDLLPSRASSVFNTPIRAALQETTRADASATSRRLSGKGLSAQSYKLGLKILEIDGFLSRSAAEVIEVHPEIAFAQMNGGPPVPWSKKTWAGYERRLALLTEQGIELPDPLGDAGTFAGVDDVLDAAAAAWIARHHVQGNTRSLPDPPEPMTHGGVGAIWVRDTP